MASLDLDSDPRCWSICRLPLSLNSISMMYFSEICNFLGLYSSIESVLGGKVSHLKRSYLHKMFCDLVACPNFCKHHSKIHMQRSYCQAHTTWNLQPSVLPGIHSSRTRAFTKMDVYYTCHWNLSDGWIEFSGSKTGLPGLDRQKRFSFVSSFNFCECLKLGCRISCWKPGQQNLQGLICGNIALGSSDRHHLWYTSPLTVQAWTQEELGVRFCCRTLRWISLSIEQFRRWPVQIWYNDLNLIWLAIACWALAWIITMRGASHTKRCQSVNGCRPTFESHRTPKVYQSTTWCISCLSPCKTRQRPEEFPQLCIPSLQFPASPLWYQLLDAL